MWITSRVPKLLRPFPSTGPAWEGNAEDLMPTAVDAIQSGAWASNQRSEMHPSPTGEDTHWEADSNGDLMPREEAA